MKTCQFREFKTDYTNQISVYRFETKMTDFHNGYSKKSITGIIANLTEDDSGGGYFVHIEYRTTMDSSFSHLAFMAYDGELSPTTIKDRRFYKELDIKDIYNIQLRIKVSSWGGSDVGLNDIFLVYREYRPVTSEFFGKE